jgi:hypothetical protein
VLATTVEDAYRDLDEASRIEDDEEAAGALAAHARRHPVARLLCHHGLPMWHGGPDPCRMLMRPDGTACLGLGQVRTMMAGLRGVEDLARHIVTSSHPARPDQVAAALRWPILPGYLTKPARAETERDGELFLDRCDGGARLIVLARDVDAAGLDAFDEAVAACAFAAHVECLVDADDAAIKAALLSADALLLAAAHGDLVRAAAMLGTPVVTICAEGFATGAGLAWEAPDASLLAASVERLRADAGLRAILRERAFAWISNGGTTARGAA